MSQSNGDRLGKRHFYGAYKKVIIDEHLAAQVIWPVQEGGEPTASHLLVDSWGNRGIEVVAPACWSYLLYKKLFYLYSGAEDEPQEFSPDFAVFQVLRLTRVRMHPHDEELILRTAAMAEFLRNYGDDQFVRDAEYLSLAELLDTVVWTADRTFKERVSNLAKLSIFERAFQKTGSALSIFLPSDSPSTSSELGWDVKTLSARVRLVSEKLPG